MPFLIGRSTVLSVLTLGVFGTLVGFMVVGPSNRHSYSEAQCWERYTRARTYVDTLAIDRLLFNAGTPAQTFCATVRLSKHPELPKRYTTELFQR
jgi:hypothetical protein